MSERACEEMSETRWSLAAPAGEAVRLVRPVPELKFPKDMPPVQVSPDSAVGRLLRSADMVEHN